MRRLIALLALLLFPTVALAEQPFGPGPIPGVQGPASATSGHIATFNGTTGSLIQDGGAPATGTVTSVGCGAGLTGGTITTTGTCALDFTQGNTWTGATVFNNTVSGTGITSLFASPPSIGNSAASSGAFTTLSASSTVSGTGFSTYLASPPAIGGSAAAAGNFTTLGATSTITGGGSFSVSASGNPTVGGTTSAAAWTTSGIRLKGAAVTYTDTTSSGTVANVYADTLAAPVFAASSGTTFTNAYTLDVEPPTNGTNVTITTANAARFGGRVLITNTLNMNGANITGIGTLTANSGTAYSLVGSTPTATLPSVVPNRGDTTTGLGGVSGSADLIAGGVNAVHTTATTVGLPTLASSSSAQTGTVCWTTGGGNLTVDTTTTCLLSSRRFKHDIHYLPHGALAEIMALRPASFVRNATDFDAKDPNAGARHVGLIAEDVALVDKRLISVGPDGKPLGVRYAEMTALLIKGMQEQQQEIDGLKRQLTSLTKIRGATKAAWH